MRYAYYDLHDQSKGSTVVVELKGSSANVILLDPANFVNYRAGRPFLYDGGYQRSSPARLTIPRDGQWYLVVDTGGYKDRVRANVEVLEPADARLIEDSETVSSAAR